MKLDLNFLESFELNSVFDINTMILESKHLFNEYYDVKSLKLSENFESATWEFHELTSNTIENFDFKRFEPLLIFNKEIDTNELVSALKCWVIHNLSKSSPRVSKAKFESLYSICELTQGFSNNFDELINQVNEHKIYKGKNKNQKDNIKVVQPVTVERYVNSLLEFFIFYPKLSILSDHINSLQNIIDHFDFNYGSRVIPQIEDLLNFKDCLEAVTNQKDKFYLKEDVLKFYPLILWWELSSIIPIRPSEFCLLPYDCITDNHITIPRIKQRRNTESIRKNIQYSTLPIPDNIKVMIQDYKSMTAEHPVTEWLISYPSFLKQNPAYTLRKKKFVERFDATNLSFLLDEFYDEVIKDKYKLTVQRKINPGDLRHIAITSMMLQGLDRTAIEKFAGHIDIESQNAYTNHMHFWVDGEIQHLANQFKLIDSNNFVAPEAIGRFNKIFDKNINAEILKRSKLSKNMQISDTNIELELGSCKEPSMPCPTINSNFTGCYFCEHWVVSNKELKDNKNLILNEISSIYNDLHRKINFLAGLYNINNLNNEGHFRADVKTNLIRAKNEIDSDKILLAKLKYHMEDENNEQ